MSIEGRIVRELREAGFRTLTRRQWGSRHLGVYQTRRSTRRFVGPADHAFAHITVTHQGGDPREAMRDVEDIGWQRFGTGASYNWCLHIASRTILLGMPHDAAGAHTINNKNVAGFPNNLNYWGHAIAQIGMPGDPFTEWAVDAAAAIIAAEKKHGAMKDGAQLYSHSKFAWKDCACDPYRDSIPEIEHTSRIILGRDEPVPPITVPEEYADMIDEPLNVHDPKGNKTTASVTVREALTADVIEKMHGRRAAKRYLRRAQKSDAPRS